MKKSLWPFLLCCAAAALVSSSPGRIRAQLVRQNSPPPSQSPATSKQTPSGKRRTSQEVQITGDQSWSDTGIDVQPGEHIVVTATGKLRYTDAKEDNGPDGIARGFKDLLRILPFNGTGRGAPIRRVAEKDGNPGDMVNFLILGSEDVMKNVFTAAGWVKVDADVRGTVLHGILESISKESYLTMPMSPLYLFDRAQDYGWAHAEPIKVVASRNHLRIWKAPFEVDGRTLWVGAATHDIGFERDERNDGVTHKIDPDIDLERDYVEKTLISTGLVSEVTHVLPAEALKEARTATGGSFHSDGRVLVLKLNDSTGNVSAKSSKLK